MLHATLIMLLLLDIPLIRSEYVKVRGELTSTNDTLIIRDKGSGEVFIRLPMKSPDGTITRVDILREDRFLVDRSVNHGSTLVDAKGQVLRKTRFAKVEYLYSIRNVFTAAAGWKEDGEDLIELWNVDGEKASDGVFHEIKRDASRAGVLLARRSNVLYVLDSTGRELKRQTLWVVGEPCRESGFTGRWMWSRSRSFDPLMTMGDQDRAPEPPWTVPFDSSKVDIPIEGRLTIHIDSVTPRLFANKIKASTVVLKNVSPVPVRLSAFARLVPIRYQVQNEEGDWVSVSHDSYGYCGNSGGFHDVASGDSVLIPIPQFKGATPTRFRVVIPYYDTDLRQAEVVSESWEGTFNFEESEVRFYNGAYGYLEQIVGNK